MQWYNHLNKYEVRMLVSEAAEEAYKEGVVRALNENDPNGILGNKYLEYLSYRSLGTMSNSFFYDKPGEDGRNRAMTPGEALEKHKNKYPKLYEDASFYATRSFQSWWRKNVKEDHPAAIHSDYQIIDGHGRLCRVDDEGYVTDYFSVDERAKV